MLARPKVKAMSGGSVGLLDGTEPEAKQRGAGKRSKNHRKMKTCQRVGQANAQGGGQSGEIRGGSVLGKRR